MKKLHLASILIISQLINIDGDALSRDSVCVCVWLPLPFTQSSEDRF